VRRHRDASLTAVMVEPTTRSQQLAAVSAAQLATGVAGMVVALRRRHPYDVLWMHGQADTIFRDTILKGTALSAPVSNLLAQALTAVVPRRPSRGTARTLGGLGALQVAGSPGRTVGATAPAPIGLGQARVTAGRRRHRAGRGDGRTRPATRATG
jgi:hypothetical protein